MYKLFYFFPIFFYISTATWVISGFFNVKITLTLLWLPYILFLFFIVLYKKGLKILFKKNIFTQIVLLMFMLSIIPVFINSAISNIPIILYIFSFILFFGIFLILLSIYMTNWSYKQIKILHRIIVYIYLFDLFISIIIAIGTIKGFIPLGVFYINPKYTVIGFNFMGNHYIRIPGIFESGATNALFLSFITLYLLSYIIFYKKNRYYYFLIVISSLIIILTFTRRMILIYIIGIFSIYIISFFKRKLRYPSIFMTLIFSGLTISILFIDKLLEMFKTNSLESRMEYWNIFWNTMDYNIEHFFYGFGLIQIVISKAKNMGVINLPITITDNLYLSLINYGGVIFLLVWLFYFFLILYISFKKIRTIKFGDIKLFIAGYLFTSTLMLLILGFFGSFITNIQESFLVWFWNSILLLYLTSNSQKGKEQK